MTTEAETARVLGISAPRGKMRSTLWISRAVTDGLPLSALENLVRHVAPNEKDFIFNFISKPTLARRKAHYAQWLRLSSDSIAKAKRHSRPVSPEEKDKSKKQWGVHFGYSKTREAMLSPVEGAKVARMAEVWTMARSVWGSDE